MGEVTELLSAKVAGGSAAFDQLYRLLYDELRQLAHTRVRRAGDLTLLDTTGLVHEAYLRIEKNAAVTFQDRREFMAYTARAMRSIVVDAVRRRRADCRGGDAVHLELDDATDAHEFAAHDHEILRVHEALEALGAVEERLVRVVEMRYFAGMNESEIAMALGIAVRTVARDWDKARLFLRATLR